MVWRRYTSLNPARFQSLRRGPVTPKDAPSQCSRSGLRSPAATSSGGSFFRGASRSADSGDFFFFFVLDSPGSVPDVHV